MKSISREQLIQNLERSGLLALEEIRGPVESLAQAPDASNGDALAKQLTVSGALTLFQAEAVQEGGTDLLVIGNYVLLDRLGVGGMGTVYKARHRRLKRIVAIKVMAKAMLQQPEIVQRFQREVEAVARLSHPNIVMAYDADESEAGHFLVMEFVDGSDLATQVQKQGVLPLGEAIDDVIQSARALAYAHQNGIVHRDIKPANLLRDRSGTIKVADLGLARFDEALGDSAVTSSALTRPGGVMGTVDFMSPEQAFDSHIADERADIYSLGCTLFYLLTGMAPYRGNTLVAVLLQHREAPLPKPSELRAEVPPALDAVFQKMVAKKATDRFQSMDEVIKSLEACRESLARPAATTSKTVVVSPAEARTLGGITALLVEPSRSQSFIIRQCLQEIGVGQVQSVATGQQAIEGLRTASPQLVVCAMHLDDMTGVELAKRLRTDNASSERHFVLVSGAAEAIDVATLSDSGIAAVLQKPFGLLMLGRTIQAALNPSQQFADPASRNKPEEMNVLIVDDSAAARSHVRSRLTAEGFSKLTEAGDGVQAIAQLQMTDFDLIVTDYNMPRMDGLELVGYVRRQSARPFTPIVMLTTESDEEKLNPVRQLGVSAIYGKVFEPESIRALKAKLSGR